MEHRHLRYFIAVAGERSFSRAAAVLNMAQPPLSRQIRQLEQELGVDLFDRTTRPLQLTEAGHLVFEQASQIIERFDELRHIANRVRTARQHVLRIGFVASVLYGRLPDMFRHYRATHPEVDFSLSELFSLEQITALKEGRIDIGFGRIAIDDPDIVRRVLHSERLILAVPAEHRFAEAEGPLTLADAATCEIILYPRLPRPSYADLVLSEFRRRGLKPSAQQEVRELQTALGLVAAGLGVCIVPAAVESLRRDNVVYRPLADPNLTSPVFMSTRVGDTSPKVAHMIQLAADRQARAK